MAEALFSQSWHHVEAIRFKLRSHADIHRHDYRGQIWYVLQDHVTGQFHRFTPEAYQIIGRLDGDLTLQAVWDAVCLRLDEDMPTQDELITLVSQLYRANILMADVAPNIDDLNTRHKTIRRKKFLQRLKSPLGIRIPLLDPDKFLNKTARWVTPVFSIWGFAIWLAVLVTAILLALVNWPSLMTNTSDRVLALENIFLMALVYPVVKTIHEFGHAYVLKKWGAEVHEMGIMFLVFFPVPYVEASEAIAFPNKHQRMLVGAVGVLVEIFLAALAMIVWAYAEPGTLRTIAFNTMVISGVSTLLFNGNPLLKFDAYYVLSDYLEIPNLASRSNQYISYLLKTKILGVKDVDSPAASIKERFWLFFYSVASYCYRLFVMLAIALYVSSQFFFIGVLVALWSIYMSLLQPLSKVLIAPFKDAQLKEKNTRVMSVGAIFIAVLFLVIAVIPMPYATKAEGVFLASELGYVRAENSGFVAELVAKPGESVNQGDVLVIMQDQESQADITVLEAQVAEAQERYLVSLANLSQSDILKREVEYLEKELQRANERIAALVIRSQQDGIFDLPVANSLLGRYVQQGDLLGHVVDYGRVNATVMISEDAIESVKGDTQSIDVRLVSSPNNVYNGLMARGVPAATKDFPSTVLSTKGGGQIAADPTSSGKMQSYQRYFHIDIAVQDAPISRLEERVYVLFHHQPEPLIKRIYRSVRRVFLRQLNV